MVDCIESVNIWKFFDRSPILFTDLLISDQAVLACTEQKVRKQSRVSDCDTAVLTNEPSGSNVEKPTLKSASLLAWSDKCTYSLLSSILQIKHVNKCDDVMCIFMCNCWHMIRVWTTGEPEPKCFFCLAFFIFLDPHHHGSCVQFKINYWCMIRAWGRFISNSL